ncbi:pantoate--beta-alanine ligase [soil metagenome]
MKVIKEVAAMQDVADYFRCVGKRIGFVPTMGSLHAGHESLIRKAREDCDIVVVSIFVNPTQFNSEDDFEKYPRDFLKDYFACEKAGVDYIFNPEDKEMYDNSATEVNVSGGVTDNLEGMHRPGHFKGVATIVLKLFNIIKPHSAYFGQKDAQQIAVIKKLTEDLNCDVKIISGETIRDENGLALSSRNMNLSDKDKSEASVLNKVLNEGKRLIQEEKNYNADEVKNTLATIIKNHSQNCNLEYLEISDAETLKVIDDLKNFSGKIMISLACTYGNTRLIDNIQFAK